MPKLTDIFENSVSLPEMRLKTAVEIARLKTEAERYQQLMESATKSGDHVAANTLTKMHFNAAVEIARLKKEADRYQQLGKPTFDSGDIVATENVIAAPSSTRTINKSEQYRGTHKNVTQEPRKTRESESDWVNKQAMRLFGELSLNKGLTAS